MAFGTTNLQGSPQAVGATFFNKTINNSLRFTRGDSSRMLDSAIPSGGNRRLWTFSTWVKVADNFNQYNCIWGAGGTGTYPSAGLCFHYSRLQFFDYRHPSYTTNLISTAKFRDTGAWLNVVVVYDSAAATISTEKVKIFVNGERLTAFDTASYPSDDYDGLINDNTAGNEPTIGFIPGFDYSDFYLAEMYLIDGQKLTPASFGELKNGIWIPKKYTGTFGTTGFHLTFSDSSNVGNDSSGLNNHFDDVDNIVATDVVTDTPTNNWCTLNPLKKNTQTQTFAEGNLDFSSTQTSTNPAVTSTLAVSSGKWYWEVYIRAQGNSVNSVGIAQNPNDLENDTSALYLKTTAYSYQANGQKRNNADVSYGDSWTAADIIGVALDLDNGAVYFYKNGTIQNSGTAAYTGLSGEFTSYSLVYSSGAQVYNFGQDASFANNLTGGNVGTAIGGGGVWKYAPPAGYKALKASNLPEPVFSPRNEPIDNSYFYTTLYEGNGGGQRVGQFLPLNEVKTVNNAILFNHGDSPYLYRTATTGDTKKMTYSGWIKRNNTSKYHMLYQAVDSQYDAIWIEPTNNYLQVILGSTSTGLVRTDKIFKDTSKWYHICVNVDTTQTTDTDRIKVWIDGDLQTLNTSGGGYPSKDAVFAGWFKNSIIQRINFEGGSTYGEGYYTDVHVVDGTAYDYTYFGQTDPSTETWIPKTVTGVTYGTNGFHLEFLNNNVGADSAGSNNLIPVNLGTANTVIDTPTKNYPTFDGGNLNSWALSEGSLYASVSSNNKSIKTTIPIFPNTGKWYWEVLRTDTASGGGDKTFLIGLTKTDSVLTDNPYTGTNNYSIYDFNGSLYFEGTNITSYGSKNQDADDIHMIAYDSFTGATWFGVNGTWYNSATATEIADGTTTNAAFIIPKHEQGHVPFIGRTGGTNAAPVVINFGQNPSFSKELTGGAIGTASDGLGSLFKYAPPTGYKALNVDNLPAKGTKGIARRKTPVITWIKNRDSTDSHMLFDSLRGPTKVAHSDTNAVETTEVNTLQKFLPGGFQIGNDVQVNTTAESYVAWNWCMHDNVVEEANSAISGAGFTNARRLLDKRVGLSIVTYTASAGTGTIDHGLGTTPDMIIATDRGHNVNWFVWHKDLANASAGTHILNLDTAGAEFNPGVNHINDTAPTSTAFAFGGYMGAHADTSSGGQTKMLWSFKSVPGFSKFGSYIGNNNADGPYAHCGFKPGFLFIKNIENGAADWLIYDNQRDTYNQMQYILWPSLNNATYTSNLLHVDFLSNGFKIRNGTYGQTNGSAQKHIFWAMAEEPFKYANAR